MTEMNFDCPNCGQNVDAPVEMAGQTVDCPACQQPLTIPTPEPSSGNDVASPEPSAAEAAADAAPVAPPSPPPVPAAPGSPDVAARPGLRKPAAVVAPRPQSAAPAPRPATPAGAARPAITLHPKSPSGRVQGSASVPSSAPTAAAAAGVPIVKRLAEPLYRVRGWMKFLGVLFIINGVLQALTIVGLIWLWMGLLLNGASNAVREAYEKDREAPLALAQQKLRTFFKVMGIYAIVMLALVPIVVLVLLLFGGAMFAASHGAPMMPDPALPTLPPG